MPDILKHVDKPMEVNVWDLVSQVIESSHDPVDLVREQLSNICANEVSAHNAWITFYSDPEYGPSFVFKDDGIGMDFTNDMKKPGREQTLKMAAESVSQIRSLAEAMPESDIRLEFSPEEYTDTDLWFALELCEAVFEAWGSATADGNGPISAFVHGIQRLGAPAFTVDDYHEQAIGKGADAQAVAYVPLRLDGGKIVWGVGLDTNIDQAAVRAIIAGVNRMASVKQKAGK